MNPLNYASLDASKRLQGAGIVLETEAVWRISQWGLGQTKPYAELMSSLRSHDFDQAEKGNNLAMSMTYPAPSMVEVWRELPEGFEHEGKWAWLCTTKSRKKDDTTYCAYYLPGDEAVCGSKKHNANPADALIDLLIWVRKAK